MSEKKQEVELVEGYPVHDLSYIDHNGVPQYARQTGAKTTFIEKSIARSFYDRGAFKPVDEAVFADASEELDEFAQAEKEAAEKAAAEAAAAAQKGGKK